MTPKNIGELKIRLASNKKYADSVDSIITRVDGSECIRAGIPVQVIRDGGSTAPNGKNYHIKIKASTDGIARDAGIITMEAWGRGGLTNFNANPVILAWHDHKEPIGRCVHIELAEDHMVEYWEFHEQTETSRTLKKLYEDGYLRAASVGFLVKEWKFIDELSEKELDNLIAKHGSGVVRDVMWIATRVELLETSAVAVPSDPNALQFSQAMRSAEAVGINITSVTREANMDPKNTEPTPPAPAPSPESSDRTDDGNKVIIIEDLARTVGELSDAVAAMRTQLDELVSRQVVAPTPTVDDSRGDDVTEDSVNVQIEVREGETVEEALERILDDKVRTMTGAPVASK